MAYFVFMLANDLTENGDFTIQNFVHFDSAIATEVSLDPSHPLSDLVIASVM